MSENTAPDGAVVVRRFMDPSRTTIVSIGDFSRLFAAWNAHVATFEDSPPDGLVDIMMRQGFAAAVLHLATKRRGEETAFTINIKNPSLNLFFSGDNTKCTITGRAFTRDVKTAADSRMFVESRRGDSSFRSVIEITGLDVVDIFNQYYVRSEQKNARFVEISESEFVMYFGLPIATHDWSQDEDLSPEKVRSADWSTMTPLDETTFWFQCGCDPDRMIVAMRAIYRDRVEELFLDDERVRFSCPRCGRHWWLTRDRFHGKES